MASWKDLEKLNETDVAAITRFIDNIRRTKGKYNQTQQALLDLTERNLIRILEAYKMSNAPSTKQRIVDVPGFNDAMLKKAKTSLSALEAEIKELRENANTILAILAKIG
ncbi:MAG: hypothetical protein A3D44_01310 [Candidatus Staskawiczbacteria bacterium RIFCSPHIGHO2_02_FULL_42_22]|uniref:Uncharacterized protein n=1 Tax=Candidatus Staskawiczbacteria bacterium RIFCSPHIGHO2_02_FULL_42_22 TaxID=1802207 RepID=A0A1G2I4B0_9BACT|nr:MAG: hypothetical protein A3D44_01310 [Candidatus Staskawiczbacteria bacterium RIFCSPHIGHO2_02_FULL_42_22]